ncbi:MAG: glycosyltransferase family 2 protein [Thermoleophilaceae bacterium]
MPLATVPVFVEDAEAARVVLRCLESIRATEGDGLEVELVDDGSPDHAAVGLIEREATRLGCTLRRKAENTGFAATVNVGLRRCLEQARDAIIINADVEFEEPGWVARLVAQPALHRDGLASVVGALLLYPNGSIQHAGICRSRGGHSFRHIYKEAPADLPEAQLERSCPVTAALQFIRHECLEDVGIYDERFLLGFEDVDYCLRVFASGRECVYQPAVRAVHLERRFKGGPSPKRAEWRSRSWQSFEEKYAGHDLSRHVPAGYHLEAWQLLPKLERVAERHRRTEERLASARRREARLVAKHAEVRRRLERLRRSRGWRAEQRALRLWSRLRGRGR